MEGKDSANKIATQHRLIGSLFAGLARALSARDRALSARRTASLRRVLEAHFVLEEQHYFPRLRAERPDRASDLDRLVEEHVDMRSLAEAILAEFDQDEHQRAEWQEAARVLNALHSLFERHEAAERKVVRA
jgi:hemerythrin superfamily protein